MGHFANASLVKTSVQLTPTGDGFLTTATALPMLGKEGRILAVKIREDATNNQATAGVVYIADDALTDAYLASDASIPVVVCPLTTATVVAVAMLLASSYHSRA